MNKIFLIKKDANRVDGNTDWIVMNITQFKEFIKTPEGKGRHFTKIDDDLSGQSPRIYCEVSKQQYENLLVEKRHMQYINDMKKEYPYKIISHSVVTTDDEDCTMEETITDNLDFTHSVIDKVMVEKMLTRLNSDEKWLIDELFLSDTPKTERELSRLTGIPQKTLNARKNKILKKMRNF